VLQGHDFKEGVRAVLVDKDNKPKWSPGSLDLVDAAAVSRYFEHLPASQELQL
jgi:hypothetical protein